MGGISKKDKTNIVVNDIIKSISKDPFSEKVAFDGANAIYKMLINLGKSKMVKNRVLLLSSVDLNLYNDIDKLWNQNLRKSQLRKALFTQLNDTFIPIIKNSGRFIDAYLLECNLKYTHFNDENYYLVQFNLILNKEFEGEFFISYNETFTVPIDLIITKNSLPYSSSKALLDGELITVNLFELEKYCASKVLGAYNNLIFCNKLKSNGGKIKSMQDHINKLKFQRDIEDINAFRELFGYDIEKLHNYMKILSNNSDLDTSNLLKELGKHLKGH